MEEKYERRYKKTNGLAALLERDYKKVAKLIQQCCMDERWVTQLFTTELPKNVFLALSRQGCAAFAIGQCILFTTENSCVYSLRRLIDNALILMLSSRKLLPILQSALRATGITKLECGHCSITGFTAVAATASHVSLLAARMLKVLKMEPRRVKMSFFSLVTIILQFIIDNPTCVCGQQWFRQRLYSATKTAIGRASAVNDPVHISNVSHVACAK
jgi:hypothetical protein